ncbi:MAG: hypothetical protein ABFD69_09570 [Candidatus Sumerlaeia bacterium]
MRAKASGAFRSGGAKIASQTVIFLPARIDSAPSSPNPAFYKPDAAVGDVGLLASGFLVLGL